MRRALTVKIVAAVIGVALLASTAHAQTSVDVVVGVGGGNRTLFVEDLTGGNLTTLNFGSGRQLPFRVRVEDTTMSRDGFTVSATMTNLYREVNGTLSFAPADVIASSNLAVSNPVNPLNVADVVSQVQPLINTVTTVSDLVLCGDLGLAILGGTTCQLNLSGLIGQVQNVTATVNLADLTNLPLLPQAAEPGAFTAADYVGDSLNDPNKPGVVTPTGRRMLAGTAVTDAAFLTATKTALDTMLAALTRSQIVTDAVFTAGLQDSLGLLTNTQLTTILASPTAATAQNLLAGHVLSQTGKYSSYPLLNVTVPGGAPSGTYKGTLVVTGIQP